MADRGAKNIMLLSRSSPKTTDAVDLLRDLRALGVNCQTPKCDVSSAESLRRVLVENVTSPIKGCVQGTMVLKVSGTSSLPKTAREGKGSANITPAGRTSYSRR